LVCYDLLGLTAERVPKFVKSYDSFFARGVAAMRDYCEEVRNGSFPTAAHSFGVSSPTLSTISGGSTPAAESGGGLEAKSTEPAH
jgi:3-methyl-2-oxobutanoate hydroxymethyltransferase